MVDAVSPDVRSRVMASIKSQDTKPELAVRRALHALGLRYRLHVRSLPGRPDLVFPKWGAVLFVHGCFWHGHSCYLYRPPSSREAYWGPKIAQNVERDARNVQALTVLGWRVGVVWECALRFGGPGLPAVALELQRWIEGSAQSIEIRGPAERPAKSKKR